MTGVAIDASSRYSDLQTHNLPQSVEDILWSPSYAGERRMQNGVWELHLTG